MVGLEVTLSPDAGGDWQDTEALNLVGLNNDADLQFITLSVTNFSPAAAV